jgi:hypothetical protein
VDVGVAEPRLYDSFIRTRGEMGGLLDRVSSRAKPFIIRPSYALYSRAFSFFSVCNVLAKVGVSPADQTANSILS